MNAIGLEVTTPVQSAVSLPHGIEQLELTRPSAAGGEGRNKEGPPPASPPPPLHDAHRSVRYPCSF